MCKRDLFRLFLDFILIRFLTPARPTVKPCKNFKGQKKQHSLPERDGNILPESSVDISMVRCRRPHFQRTLLTIKTLQEIKLKVMTKIPTPTVVKGIKRAISMLVKEKDEQSYFSSTLKSMSPIVISDQHFNPGLKKSKEYFV